MQKANHRRNDRDATLFAWVDSTLGAGGRIVRSRPTLIAGDASFRRFWRISDGPRSLVAMDAPPATENNAQFVRLSAWFRRAGVHVPEVFAFDLERGFLLVSDLGSTLYADVYASPEKEAAFEAALATLVRLRHIDNPSGLIPPYAASRFFDEAELFATWFVRGLLGVELDAGARRVFDDAVQHLVRNVLEQPRVCVHRDYHSRNLLWGTDGVARLVDFQDALWGPITYDVASLLRDCYVRLPEGEIGRWRERWIELTSDAGIALEAALVTRWVDLTAVQRQLKAIGIFARLLLRDGRNTHLVHIVPVLDHLIDVCAGYAELHALRDWLAMTLRPAAAHRLGTIERHA